MKGENMLKRRQHQQRPQAAKADIIELLLEARVKFNLPEGQITTLKDLSDKAATLTPMKATYIRACVTREFNDEERRKVGIPLAVKTSVVVER